MDSRVQVLVLDSQPVVNASLTNSFVVEPPTHRQVVDSGVTETFGRTAHSTHTRCWSLILRSWMRSGFRLFIFLSVSRMSKA